MIQALDISASALAAQRVRLDVISGNIANASVTRQADGTPEPYQRRVVLFAPQAVGGGTGLQVAGVVRDESEFPLRYDPGHPDAIPDGSLAGYVRLPNVNLTLEYVDALEASRAYEANLAMMNLSRDMIRQSIQLFA